MKKYSILTGVLFGLIIFGFTQNIPFAYAAQGDLGGIIESFEFDASDGTTPQLIQISDTVYAVAYVGTSGDGKIATFTIADDGDIGTLVAGSPVTFDSGTVTAPKIFHVTESRYAIAYVEGTTIKFSTFTISDSGSISTPVNGAAPAVTNASAPDIVKLSGNIGDTQNYALAYTTDSTDLGRVSTFSITSTGTFASINTGTTFATTAFDIEILKISDSTQKFVVAYRDTDVVATAKGQVEIVTITDAGTVTPGNITYELNQAGGDGGSALLISTLSKMDIAHVTGTTYAVVWADTADAKIQTITIPDDGSSIASIAISSALDASGVPIDPVFLQTDIGVDPLNFIVAYHESTGITGELRSVTISADGNTITNVDTLQFDGTSPGGQTPSLVHRTGDNYAVAYRGTGSDGFVSSFNLGDDGGDVLKPTFTASKTSATSITLTFSENVDTTTTNGVGYAVTGTTVNANSDPAGTSTTMTLTFNAIADTSVTPTVTYTSAAGTTVDTATTPNEVANNFNAVAADNAPATFSASRTAPNTFALTFSENVDGTATAGSFTVAGADASATITDPGGTTGLTITTTGLITTSGTPAVNYVAATGDLVDAATTPNEIANGGAVAAVDNVGPSVLKVLQVGARTVSVTFSEAVTAATADYTNYDLLDNGSIEDAAANSATINSDTPETVLVTFSDAADATAGQLISFSVSGADDTSAAVNAQTDDGKKTIAAQAANLVTTTTLVDDDGDGTVDFPITTDTLVTAIIAPANTAPVITTENLADATNAVSNGRNLVTAVGGVANTAKFASALSVTSGTSVIEIEAGIDVGFSGGGSQSITIAASSKDASTDANFLAAHTGIDLAGATIVEFGNTGKDIFFSAPVKVTIPSIAGSELIFSIDNANNVLEILTCGTAQASSAAAAGTLGVIGSGTTVLIDGDACFFGNDIWTYHFSGFGGGSTPTSTSSTGGGGGGGGDSVKPSVDTAFADNEFPLAYDGVYYQSDQFDTVHTAIIGTGNEFKTTLSIYENEGAGNLQHVEIYVNHFGSQILNNLSETVVIYDEQTGLEIIDPNNLITTADIIPSISGNKAVFDFVLVFENEIPLSDVLFRLWDTNRNSLQIHLPDALIVEISEQSSGILSEPSSETTQTVDPTIVDQTVVDQATANLEAAELVTQAAATEAAAAIAAATAAQTAASNDPSLADIATAAQTAADQATANLAAAELVEQTAKTKATQLTAELVEQTAIIEPDSTTPETTEAAQAVVDQAAVDLAEAESVVETAMTIVTQTAAAASAAQTAASNDSALASIAEAAQVAADQAVADLESAQTAVDQATVDLAEAELVVQTAIIEPDSTTPETTEILESDSESTFGSKTWTGGQISVLEKWGGYDEEPASDIEVLAKFGIKGEIIPQYTKNLVRWVLNDQMSYEEFIDVLQFYKREGLLLNSDDVKSFIDPQIGSSGFTSDKYVDESISFESDKNNELNLKADVDSLDEQIRTLRSLTNSAEIHNELKRSNLEFETSDNIYDLISERNSEWLRNPKTITPFMESLMNTESALIIIALIEHNAEDLTPITSISITNAYGANVILSEKTYDYKQGDKQWWDKTRINNILITSGFGSEEYTGLYTAEISMTVNDDQGNFIGIIKAIVNFDKMLLSD